MIPSTGIGLYSKVLPFKKPLYGLKQAPSKCYEKLLSVLASIGFKQ